YNDNTFLPLYNFEDPGLGTNYMVGIGRIDNKIWAGDGTKTVAGVTLQNGLTAPSAGGNWTGKATFKNRIRLGMGNNTALGMAEDNKVEVRGRSREGDTIQVASSTNTVVAIGRKLSEAIVNGDANSNLLFSVATRGGRWTPDRPTGYTGPI